MCGINGIINLENSSPVSKSLLIEMRDSMTHRGPDSKGHWISSDKQLGFGFRRLSIIDLSDNANQPMRTQRNDLTIVFNGEIYNHSEIKQELEKKFSFQWRTSHSDTEVILFAFKAWGIKCIQKFRGMFAIAIWDNKTKELWLIRDRIGIKPLYYCINNGKLLFASEIKSILCDKNIDRVVDEESFFHYLSFLTSPAPNTLFKNIKKIPAGCHLKVSKHGKIEIKKYWDVLDHIREIDDNENTISRDLLQLIEESVNYRKVSDVPVGVFLSGGIDSSTNAALFSKRGATKIKTFSIGYKGNNKTYKNELEYARLVSESLNSDHFEKLLSPDDLIEFLPDMIRLQDEPISDPVCFPLYYLSKLAKENGVTVCQVGEGADELFWGYEYWRKMYFIQILHYLPFTITLKKIILRILHFFGFKYSRIYELLRRSSLEQNPFWGGAEAFTHEEKMDILSLRLKQKFSKFSSWEAIKNIRKVFDYKQSKKNIINWMTYMDLNLRLPELLLMRVDKMSMGASLEARVPFLDHKLVEYGLSLPTNIKTKNFNLKYILKKSVTGLISDQIIKRKKQGFDVPLHDWFFDKLGNEADKTLETFCKETDFFDYEKIINLKKKGEHRKIWYILNFALWWNHYIKK